MRKYTDSQLIRIMCQFGATYLVIRIAIDFANDNIDKTIYKLCWLIFIGIVYFYAKHKIKKNMNIFWISYFILNTLGGVYEIIKFEIKPDKEFPNNPDIPEIYESMPLIAKIALKSFTFMINIVFWLPMKIIKPLLVK